jgi:sulfur carrier protein ThiS
MKIHIVLHSILREKLPPLAHGKTVIELPEGSHLKDALTRLDIAVTVVCAVNGEIEKDLQRVLIEGDEVRCFRASGGG